VIHFQLVSSTGSKFEDDVYEVLVPTRGGTIAVFEDHMPLISAGASGVISVRKKPTDRDDDMAQFAVSGGIIEVDGKNIRATRSPALARTHHRQASSSPY
jgi:F0F1-type ATP synthase epsilon subunit